MAAPPGESSKAVYGAFLLARLDASGMDYFRNTSGAFWRSFRVALYIAPFYAALLMMRYAAGEVSTPVLRYIVIEIIAYVIAWVAFPVIMDYLTKVMDRREKFIRYIVAYNWAAILQNMLYLPLAMLSVNGILPPDSGSFWALSCCLPSWAMSGSSPRQRWIYPPDARQVSLPWI